MCWCHLQHQRRTGLPPSTAAGVRPHEVQKVEGLGGCRPAPPATFPVTGVVSSPGPREGVEAQRGSRTQLFPPLTPTWTPQGFGGLGPHEERRLSDLEGLWDPPANLVTKEGRDTGLGREGEPSGHTEGKAGCVGDPAPTEGTAAGSPSQSRHRCHRGAGSPADG